MFICLQRVCKIIGNPSRSGRVTRRVESVLTADERLQKCRGVRTRGWCQVTSRDDTNVQLHRLRQSVYVIDTTYSRGTTHASSRDGEGKETCAHVTQFRTY